MPTLIFIVASMVILTSIVYIQAFGKENKEQSSPCMLPNAEHGRWIIINDSMCVYKFIPLKCDKDYVRLSNKSIICGRKYLLKNNLYCIECQFQDPRNFHKITKSLYIILPSIAFFVIIVIVIIVVLLKNKKSKDSVPIWTKKKEDRAKKNSAQAEVYKDLVETSRRSFRFPFFKPKGPSTGKKPMILEEGGYLVPERRRESNSTEVVKTIIQSNNNPDIEVAVSNKVEETNKHEKVAEKIIKELQCKQAAVRNLPANTKTKSQSKHTIRHHYNNIFSGLFGEHETMEETSQISPCLRLNHTYANLKERGNVLEQTRNQRGKNKEQQNVQQEIPLKQTDQALNDSTSLPCRKIPTNDKNECLELYRVERTNIPTTKCLQVEDKICISLEYPETEEDTSVASSTSKKGLKTNTNKQVISTNEPLSVELTESNNDDMYINIIDDRLQTRNLYCNLGFSIRDEIESVEESPPSSHFHVYANIQLR